MIEVDKTVLPDPKKRGVRSHRSDYGLMLGRVNEPLADLRARTGDVDRFARPRRENDVMPPVQQRREQPTRFVERCSYPASVRVRRTWICPSFEGVGHRHSCFCKNGRRCGMVEIDSSTSAQNG